MATKTILLDVGGTYIKCSDGRDVPSASAGTWDDIASAIRKAIGPLKEVSGIGVAIPGPFDYNEGVFLMKHKFSAVYGESFRSLAKLPASIGLKFAHDVNAVLMGAVRMLDIGNENAALVTMGTGLGFSHAVAGKVQFSPSGSPAYSLWNKPAAGGGILEDRLSARGITAAYAEATGDKNRTPLQIARMAYSGNPEALAVYSRTGARLGAALRPVLEELDIRKLLIGGQIAGSLSLMLEPLQKELPGITIIQAPAGAVFEGLRSLFETN